MRARRARWWPRCGGCGGAASPSSGGRGRGGGVSGGRGGGPGGGRGLLREEAGDLVGELRRRVIDGASRYPDDVLAGLLVDRVGLELGEPSVGRLDAVWVPVDAATSGLELVERARLWLRLGTVREVPAEGTAGVAVRLGVGVAA